MISVIIFSHDGTAVPLFGTSISALYRFQIQKHLCVSKEHLPHEDKTVTVVGHN